MDIPRSYLFSRSRNRLYALFFLLSIQCLTPLIQCPTQLIQCLNQLNQLGQLNRFLNPCPRVAPLEQADDHEDFTEEAHFWRNREQQYRRGPKWTRWTEENEYYDQGPTQARNIRSYPEDYLHPDTPDPRVPTPTDKSAGRLIRSTQQLYHRHSAVIQVPIYILNATIDMKLTNPLFYKHQKSPSTIQQAVVALYRIVPRCVGPHGQGIWLEWPKAPR